MLQVGGGFRTEEAVDAAIALGVDRVLVGTVAFRDPDLLDRLVARHGDRICVTADTLDGTVRVAGWAEDAGVQVVDAIRDLSARGVGAFLVTAIERDGTLAGHDLRLLEAVRAATDGILLASGGVGTVAHVRGLPRRRRRRRRRRPRAAEWRDHAAGDARRRRRSVALDSRHG